MKKSIFRMTALILSILAAIPAYSCGNGGTGDVAGDQTGTNQADESTTAEVDVFSALRRKDFGGAKVTILCRYDAVEHRVQERVRHNRGDRRCS